MPTQRDNRARRQKHDKSARHEWEGCSPHNLDGLAQIYTRCQDPQQSARGKEPSARDEELADVITSLMADYAG